MASRGRGARDKGLKYERELVEHFSTSLSIQVARGVAGAQAFDKSKGSTDIFGLPHLAVEAKRTERFTLREYMEQVTRNAGDEIPVLIHRFSRQPTGQSSVVLTLDNFLKFYNAYLILNGFKKDDRFPPSS